MESKTISESFESIIQRRLWTAISWSFLLQLLPLSLYVIIFHFDPVHPILWFRSVLGTILEFRTWLLFAILGTLIAALGMTTYKKFEQPRPYFRNRFQVLCSLFSHTNLLTVLLYIMISATIIFSYLRITSEYLITSCKILNGQNCVVEKNIFILCGGIWVALFYFISFLFSQHNLLKFSVIKQYKFLKVRSELPGMLSQSVKSSFLPTASFIIFYYWKGIVIINYLKNILKVEQESYLISSISGVFNIPLFFQAWLLYSIFHFYIILLNNMLVTHLTYSYQFALGDEPGIPLSVALKSSNSLIQHLGYFCLYDISSTVNPSRAEVFTLSRPGGHPHTWNCILQECLKIIDNFSAQSLELNKPPVIQKQPSPKPKHIHPHALQTEYVLTPQSPTYKLRNLVTDSTNKTHYVHPQLEENTISVKINQYLDQLYSKPGLNYIFGTPPDSKLNHLAATSQLVIWATQSISTLSAVAIFEDKYGIVLKSLPTVVNSLIKLRCAIDKMYKFGTLNRKFYRANEFELCMKNALRIAVNQSLYRIAINYAEYINDLPLNSDDYQCILNYVNFREC